MKMPWERNDGLKKGAEKFGTPVSKAKEENRNISARLNAGAEYKGYVFHGTGNGTTAIERGDYPGGQTVMTVNGGAEEAKAWIDKNPLPPLRKNTGEVNNAAKASACPACKKPGQKIIDSEGGRVARADGWECSCGNMWATDPKTGAVQNGVGGEAAVRLNAANIEAAAQSGSSSGGGVDSSATGYQQTEKTTTDDGKLKENAFGHPADGCGKCGKCGKDFDGSNDDHTHLDEHSPGSANYKKYGPGGGAVCDRCATKDSALKNAVDIGIYRGFKMQQVSATHFTARDAKGNIASANDADELKTAIDECIEANGLENATDEDFKSKCAACNSLSKEPWSGKCGNCLANYDGEENGEKKEKSNDIPPPQGEPWDQESYNGKDQGERVNEDKPIAEDAGKTGESIRGVENGEKWTPVEVKDSPKIADGWYPKSSVDGIDDRDWFASRAECEAECERMNEHGLSSKERKNALKNAGHLAAEPWSVASDDERMGWLLSAGQDADLARFEWTDISMDAQKALQDVWDMPASRNEPGADPEGADGRGQTTPVAERVNAYPDETKEFPDEAEALVFVKKLQGSGRSHETTRLADGRVRVVVHGNDDDGSVLKVKKNASPKCPLCGTSDFKPGATSQCDKCHKEVCPDCIAMEDGDNFLCDRCAGRQIVSRRNADDVEQIEREAQGILHEASEMKEGRENSKETKCEGAGPHAAGEVRRMDFGGGMGHNLCRKCWDAMNKHARKGDFEPKDWNSGQVLNSITGTELTLKLKGRRNAGVAAGEAKYGSRENAGDGKWHLDWGGAGQPACGKTTQDGFRVAKDGKDVDCPKCLDIAERNRY